MSDQTLRRSPLDATHRSLGARMVPFAGWELPIQYSGIVEEVHAVRERAGLFDVSHMGRLFVSGPGGIELLGATLTYDPAKVQERSGHYNLFCDEHGGILDDPYLYRLGAERWLLVGNASRYEADVRWLQGHRRTAMDVRLDDRQESTAMLALQGPGAKHAFAAVFSSAIEAAIPRHGCYEIELHGTKALVARSGYTGEDGFEFVCSVDAGRALWDHFLAANVTPCGLGARDLLRLEAALALYGNDIDATTNPWEAGLGWVVSLDGDRQFEGRAALGNAKGATARRLSCIKAMERAVLRAGYPIQDGGAAVGTLTSGTFSPTLNAGIGLAYLPLALAKPGTQLTVDVRGRSVPVEVVKRPFYHGSAT